MRATPGGLARRDFFRLTADGALLAVAGCSVNPSAGDAGRGNVGFTNPLRIPPLDGGAGPSGRRSYELAMQEGSSELVPGKPARTWGSTSPTSGPPC